MQTNVTIGRGVILALAILSVCGQATGEIRLIIPNDYVFELSVQDEQNLLQVPIRLIKNPSTELLDSIRDNVGEAWLEDQRNQAHTEYELAVLYTFPTRAFDEHRTVKPWIMCEGNLNPVVLAYCSESSNFTLTLPKHGEIKINNASITLEKAQAMLAFLDSAGLESPAGARLAAHGVRNILYNSTVGVYHLIGDTEDGAYFSVKLRPVGEPAATTFEVSDWSCGDPIPSTG